MDKFSKDFFISNRNRLSKSLPDSLIVLVAHSALQYSADTAYKFRQESNFWYLSGIDSPDVVLIINTAKSKTTLLLPEQNEYQKLWDGEFNQSELMRLSGISDIGKVSDLQSVLKNAKKNGLKMCYTKPHPERIEPYGFYSNPSVKKLADDIYKIDSNPKNVRLDIARLRQVKQKCEIDAIQGAIDVTGSALAKTKANLKNINSETEIERYLSEYFYSEGGDGHGFDPIVASAGNAAIIHYNKNNSNLSKNNMVLLDVGAKLGHYSADISRVWGVGIATKRQRDIYEAVKDIQQQAFELLKPGVLLKDCQNKVETLTKEVMTKLGCSNANDKYPHGVSHFLGVDVHDAGDYSVRLAKNMVLTVEPGIYLPDEGIGVRLEDVVVITDTGIKILSDKIPKNL